MDILDPLKPLSTILAPAQVTTTLPLVDLGAPSYDEEVAEERRKKLLTK
jgi:hypothetical protein